MQGPLWLWPTFHRFVELPRFRQCFPQPFPGLNDRLLVVEPAPRYGDTPFRGVERAPVVYQRSGYVALLEKKLAQHQNF